MRSFRYAVGRPEEDAFLLVSGLSDPHAADGVTWRNCSRVFRLRAPVSPDGPTRVTLRMRFSRPSPVSVCLDERELGSLDPTAGPGDPADWADYDVEIPPGAGEALVTLTCRCASDPYLPPRAKLEANRADTDLAEVSVEGDGLDVPERVTAARIETAPIRLTNLHRSVAPRRGPEPAGPERTVFFGDIHVHSNFSMCGHPNNGTINENAAAAKARGLDFIAFSDHCEHMDADAWRRYWDEIDAASAKHDLPIIPAVEWTSREHGHRNIYFRRARPPQFDYFLYETDHPAKLAGWFARNGLDALAVPHHFPYVSQSGNIGSICPDIEPLMEIYSHWGSSECYGARLQETARVMPGCTVADALARGLKLGFVGGGDCHNDLPGDGGLTGVLAEACTVEAVFDAMRQRLCYATSGRRILLDFSVNGFPGGSVLAVNPYTVSRLFPLKIAAKAVGDAPVERIELLECGQVVAESTNRVSAGGNEISLAVSMDQLATPARRAAEWTCQLVNHSRYYYVRLIQADGSMAWSSPVFVDFEPLTA